MTDPRMTPTNDAPVTVEQAVDAEVARIMAMSDDEIMREADAGDAAWARSFKLGLASGKSAAAGGALHWYAENVAGCRKIGRDGDVFRQALDADGGKRALAALASAPAGDGDRDEWLRGDWYEKWQDATEDANDSLMATLEALRGRVERTILAALARPRAAVGKQSRVVWFKVCPSTGDFTGEYCTEKPDDLTGLVPMVRLALQSPPAKVEG